VGRLVRRPGHRRTDRDPPPPAGVFATASIGGASGLIEGNPRQLLIQPCGVAVTLVWSDAAMFVLPKLVSALAPLRVSREHELEGLDISQHGEAMQ
jgi:Amt family ammonium transporter